MATPSFSPAPSKNQQRHAKSHASQQPPSTAELYKFMSLNYDSYVSRNLERYELAASFSRGLDTIDAIVLYFSDLFFCYTFTLLVSFK